MSQNYSVSKTKQNRTKNVLTSSVRLNARLMILSIEPVTGTWAAALLTIPPCQIDNTILVNQMFWVDAQSFMTQMGYV